MKTVFKIILWIVGLFLIILSLFGFSQGDIGLAIFILCVGLFSLPLIHGLLFKKKKQTFKEKKEVVNQKEEAVIRTPPPTENNGSTDNYNQSESKRTPTTVKIVNNLKDNSEQKKKTGGFFKWFGKQKNIFKSGLAINSSIKDFPNISDKKIETITKTKEYWSYDDKNKIKKVLLDGFDRKINIENIASLGSRYLTFYQSILSDYGADELTRRFKYVKVQSFAVEEANKTNESLSPAQITKIVDYSISQKDTELNNESKVKSEFKFYVMNWEIENNLFTSLPTDFILNKNELCIFKLPNCEMLETKQVTRRINYGGPSFRMNLGKGISYRVGSYDFSTTKEDQEISKGIGDLNITTKRILFKASGRVTTIKSNTIVDIDPYQNAVVIFKESGNPITIKTNQGLTLYQYLKTMTRN